MAVKIKAMLVVQFTGMCHVYFLWGEMFIILLRLHRISFKQAKEEREKQWPYREESGGGCREGMGKGVGK